jgi:hypothetical protein
VARGRRHLFAEPAAYPSAWGAELREPWREVVARGNRRWHARWPEDDGDLVARSNHHVAEVVRHGTSIHVHMQRSRRSGAVGAQTLIGESHPSESKNWPRVMISGMPVWMWRMPSGSWVWTGAILFHAD